ncbi:MAG: tetratricopeptide repeat protein [Hyphomicrobiaceae bacterium]
MRTFKRACLSLIASIALSAAAFAAGGVTFRTPEEALKQGIAAFNGGFYELALPALETAAESNPIMGTFYIARIYGDNEGSYTDHLKAYNMFRKLADELRDVDPDDEDLAPIAAKALTEVSRYLRSGIAEGGLKPNPLLADSLLQRAALFFNDEDAQFELAKVFLRGEGPDLAFRARDEESKIENGIHWLSRLSKKGHPGAQAFLADLLWRGKFVPRDQIAALNLIDVAVSNASPTERLWIEDIYQNIFCNAGEGVRRQATGQVAEWRTRYGRRHENSVDKSGLDQLAADPIRTCANGEPVMPIGAPAAKRVVDPSPTPEPPVKHGLRDVGVGFTAEH